MTFMLGAYVREYGNPVGRLAGFEVEPDTGRVMRLVFSPRGDLGPDALSVGLLAVGHVHPDGQIELRPECGARSLMPAPNVALIGPATRVKSGGQSGVHLTEVELDPSERRIVSLTGRKHWWTRSLTLSGSNVDYFWAGEIRQRAREGSSVG
jgi:hypothetical protein